MSFGWLHDGKRFVQPASQREAELFEKNGFVEILPFAGASSIRMKVVTREWERRPRVPVEEGWKKPSQKPPPI